MGGGTVCADYRTERVSEETQSSGSRWLITEVVEVEYAVDGDDVHVHSAAIVERRRARMGIALAEEAQCVRLDHPEFVELTDDEVAEMRASVLAAKSVRPMAMRKSVDMMAALAHQMRIKQDADRLEPLLSVHEWLMLVSGSGQIPGRSPDVCKVLLGRVTQAVMALTEDQYRALAHLCRADCPSSSPDLAFALRCRGFVEAYTMDDETWYAATGKGLAAAILRKNKRAETATDFPRVMGGRRA
jgi:hypothetical protein